MYNALIIGAGQIAGGYDSPQDESVLTHAHAYSKHKGFNLLGFYDVDFSKASEMAKKWGVKAFKSLDEVGSVDVISICSPDSFHLASLKETLKLNPKLIFLEKPLSDNLYEAKEILEISKKIPILVNYSRRFVPEIQELAKTAKGGAFGEFLYGVGYYGKGFIHNGSHMTNLLDLLVGKITKVDIVHEFEDFYPNDKTKTAILSFDCNKFTMKGIDCRNYTIFELDLFFEKSRVRILDSGNKLEIYEVKESGNYAGYKNLILKEVINTELNLAMLHAVENIYRHLENNEPLKSTVEKAFEAINYG
ncbi:MAG TPA: Gfo/Idh/MocA family oxidoreductase [Candidatus Gastranaerophilaceae bacterium]|nr:Gfo/Idh/MocA family oxidoreductase [Candidatus Gastranaerophilaceae bacterium]HPT42116.1 Gfo/Idh/MocA family oxidoreductase [Candidatus Gastranaerophilaceae bacterium]